MRAFELCFPLCAQIGAEWLQNDRWLATWKCTGSALAAVIAKDPQDLTRDDMRLVACDRIPMSFLMSRGMWLPMVMRVACA